MKTTLVIMAAGIGSRFGTGIKQLTKMNDAGEIIIDYSIYDAKEAGFDKVVFVIRHAIEEEFKEVIGNRIAQYIPVEYVYQELDQLPEGFSVPEGRTKPWGTGQAILPAKVRWTLRLLLSTQMTITVKRHSGFCMIFSASRMHARKRSAWRWPVLY